MRKVEIGGREFAYVRRGQGEPLLLVQGMSGHHRLWGDEFFDQLAQHFDVVAFNHRGVGASSWANGSFTVADLADDCAGVIAGMGWDNAHVFGVSLGGMVVQELALRHPSRVKTLTIGCSWVGGAGVSLTETVRRMVAAVATNDIDHTVRTAFEANFSPVFAASPANFARYAELAMAESVPVPVILLQWEASLQHSTGDRLPTLTMPTMVLHGRSDAMIPVRNGVHMASLIPNARLELFDDAGHLFWWEYPDRTIELLVEHALKR